MKLGKVEIEVLLHMFRLAKKCVGTGSVYYQFSEETGDRLIAMLEKSLRKEG